MYKRQAQQGIGAAQHEVCILEVEQHAQAADEGDEQKGFAQGGLCVKMLNGKAADIVDEEICIRDSCSTLPVR